MIKDQRVTKDATLAPAKNGAGEKLPSIDEKVSWNQESKETEGVVCERAEGIGKEQSPARAQAPPQKRRSDKCGIC